MQSFSLANKSLVMGKFCVHKTIPNGAKISFVFGIRFMDNSFELNSIELNWLQFLENISIHTHYRSFLPSNSFNQWMNELHAGHCKSMNFHTYARTKHVHAEKAPATQFGWPFYSFVVRFAHASTHTYRVHWERHTHYTYTIQTKWLRRIQVQTEKEKKTHSVGQRIVCDLSLNLIIMIDLSKCHENSTYLYCVLRAYTRRNQSENAQTYTHTRRGTNTKSPKIILLTFHGEQTNHFKRLKIRWSFLHLELWKINRNFCNLNDIHCMPAISELFPILSLSLSLLVAISFSPFSIQFLLSSFFSFILNVSLAFALVLSLEFYENDKNIIHQIVERSALCHAIGFSIVLQQKDVRLHKRTCLFVCNEISIRSKYIYERPVRRRKKWKPTEEKKVKKRDG